MSGPERIERAIRGARAAGRPSVAAFVTAGFPGREGFEDVLAAVSSAADVVEIGVPFSDPMADGVTIQRSSRAALDAGVTLSWILDVVRRSGNPVPILLMSYLNPLLAHGLERFAGEAASAGVAGVIVPDLPYEECPALLDALDRHGIALIQLVTPLTPPDRLRVLCEASRGFVYAVTSVGTTGGRTAILPGVLEYLDRVRGASRRPVLAGFGIRTGEQLRALAGHADGVVVGSALVEVLERGDDPAAFLGHLLETARAPRPEAGSAVSREVNE